VEDKKTSWTFFNQTVCALRFLYRRTLRKDWLAGHIPFPKQDKRLPEVLSVAEVSKLFDCVRTVKSRTILQTMYAAGLRLTEALRLRPNDIDSARMVIRVQQGKGRHDRYVTFQKGHPS
jgi:integrase/recombinase XerD